MTKKAYQLDDLTVLWEVYSTFFVLSDLSVKRQTNQTKYVDLQGHRR